MKKKTIFGKLFSKKEVVIKEVDNSKIITPGQAVFNNFKSNKLAVTGLFMFILVVATVFIGSALLKFDENYVQTTLQNIAPGANYLKAPASLNGNVKKIVSGTSFSYAIDKSNKLHYWGVDVDGALKVPEKLKSKSFSDIAVSDNHVVAVDSNGELHLWGNNSGRQLELDEVTERKVSTGQVKKVIAGRLYSGVVMENKQIHVWGTNSLEQIALKTDWKTRVVDAVALPENIILLLDDGSVKVTGINILSSSLPESLANGEKKVVKIAGAYLNGLALTADNELISWGGSHRGLEITKQYDKKIKDIVGGYAVFHILFEDGTVETLGTTAVYGEQLSVKENVDTIYAGYFQNYAVMKDNTIKPWGLKGFLLGSDEFGRDVFVRLVHGGKTSLLVGIVAVLISTFIGLLIGTIAGFVGGVVDNVLMRFSEIVTSIPFLPLLITLSSIIGTRLTQNQRMYLVMVIIGVLSWVGLARLVRGQILVEREKDFVLAARALGIRQYKIILKHILPSVLSIAIVNMSLSYGGMMLTEAGLSFLGFGVMPPTPTWGNMLNGAQKAEVIQFYWWRWVFPALAVFITVLAVNLAGDGIRDAVDPKANEK